jgi:hypothetical protein
VYGNGKMCFIRSGETLFVFPRRKLRYEDKDGMAICNRYREQLRAFLTKAHPSVINLDVYKNPFSYLMQQSMLVTHSSEQRPPTNLDFKKILFEEFFEGTIYNMFCFYNSILINNNAKRQTYK